MEKKNARSMDQGERRYGAIFRKVLGTGSTTKGWTKLLGGEGIDPINCMVTVNWEEGHKTKGARDSQSTANKNIGQREKKRRNPGAIDFGQGITKSRV